MKKLNVVLSGYSHRDEIEFWNGFINIQKALLDKHDVKIYGHTWNPEKVNYIKRIYNSQKVIGENQPNYHCEFYNEIDSADKYEIGINRLKSTWKKVNYQSIIGQSKSRSKVLSIFLDEIPDDELILLTRWDIGNSGSREVHTPILDDSLPSDYIYLPYYPEIDEGYGDMWIVSKKKNLKKLKNYDKFLIDSLTGKNDFLKAFTEEGWPLAIPKVNQHKLSLYFSYLIKKFSKRLSKVFDFSDTRLSRKIKSLLNKQVVYLTGENSIKLTEKTNVKFPVYQALNNHAILKYFLLSNKLRDQTRFLDVSDFTKTSDRFKLINPIKLAIVIYSHSSYNDCWEMTISQFIKHFNYPNFEIFLLTENSKNSHELEDELNLKFNPININFVYYDENSIYTDRLYFCFKAISSKFEIGYFIHEDMPLYNQVDLVYLNTLLHFLDNSSEYYVKLIDTNFVDKKTNYLSFPSLVSNTGGYSISIQPSLIKFKEFNCLIKSIHDSIYDFEVRLTKMNLTALAVRGDIKKGKYSLNNLKFPHITTAISKGKWDFANWKKDLLPILEEYNVDFKTRGKL